MRAPLLHLGYIKTGSTFLQDHVFNEPEFGFSFPCENPRERLARVLTNSNPYLFDANAAREELMKGVDIGANVVPVWSEETLSGNPLSRRYDGHVTAERLSQIFPDATILVVLREQRAMALSMYKEYIKQGNRNSLTDFIGTGTEPEGYSPIVEPWYMAYSHLVSRYQKLFGKDRVLAMPFEMLRKDPDVFLGHLHKALGISGVRTDMPTEASNVGQGPLSLAATRKLNRFIVRTPLNQEKTLGRRLAGKVARTLDIVTPKSVNDRLSTALKAQISERYDGLYKEDNKRLAELTGIDFGRYGFAV